MDDYRILFHGFDVHCLPWLLSPAGELVKSGVPPEVLTSKGALTTFCVRFRPWFPWKTLGPHNLYNLFIRFWTSWYTQGTENGVEQMVSKAHQSASGHITMHQLCFALQSLFLQRGRAYTCIYIFGPAGPECGPASHRQEENRRSASWCISGASRHITIHPRYHLFYTFFVSSLLGKLSLIHWPMTE